MRETKADPKPATSTVSGGSSLLLIISAPSGAGKTTLCRELLDRVEGLDLSISHTTRAPRHGERQGVDYYFVSDEDFDLMDVQGGFIEWFHVHRNRYGTAHATVRAALAQGRDLLFDVDVKGADALKRAYPEAISVFILPPSLDSLEQRLRGRGTEDDAAVELRMRRVRSEIVQARQFDFMVINDHLDEAADDLLAIYRAMKCRSQTRLGLLDALLNDQDPPPVSATGSV